MKGVNDSLGKYCRPNTCLSALALEQNFGFYLCDLGNETPGFATYSLYGMAD